MTRLRFALFDLDDTLYPAHNGLWLAIRARMERYMVERLGLPAAGIQALRERYFAQYGTTLNGLRGEQQVNEEDYLAFVHDVPLADYLAPDHALRTMLLRIPLRRAIFTNADAAHAARVLEALGVADCFERIIDIRALDFACKPEPLAFQRALDLLGARAGECVFIDDSVRNLRGAAAAGMLTVLLAHERQPLPDGIHDQVSSVLEFEQALGRLQRQGRPAAA